VGLYNKHKNRDLEIQKHRQKLLNLIEQDLLNDENVIAVFYGGSLGDQNTDIYSDIDLRIVLKDEVFEEYRLNKKQRAKNWGGVLFYEDFPWANHSVAHYDTFVKVDTFYYKIKDIQPSVWLQNIKIVHDPTGKIKNVSDHSMKLSYQTSADEFEIWRSKFFAHTHELYRGIMRNELFYALNSLDNLRLLIAAGWCMEKEIQPNNPGYWAKLEGARSKLHDGQQKLLARWHSNREPSEIMNVLKEIILEFKRVHKSLCDKLGIEEDSKWLNDIFNMV
jgi:DNA-directed RNA polymerase subunit L